MTLATGELGSRTNGNGEMTTRERPLVQDDGQFSNLLDTGKFEHLWRVATLFSKTQLVPKHFQQHPEDCFIATSMAIRLGVDPFMFMQNTYIVYGRPGMEAKLAIALINSSGLFSDPIDYEIQGGEDPFNEKYKVRAFATRKTTGKVIYGPWVDWTTVDGEGWSKKEGSKWKTIPGLMFQYRAATFFGRLHCPERLMGMQTVEEVKDVETREVSNTVINGKRPFGPAVEQHPTDETRTIDTSTANLPPESTQDAEPDAGGVEAEAPETEAEALNLDSESKFIAYAESIASRDLIEPKVYNAAIKELRLNHGIGGGKRSDTLNRNKIALAMNTKRWDWAASKIKE